MLFKKTNKYYLIILTVSIFLALVIKIIRPLVYNVIQNNVLNSLVGSLPSLFATTGFCMLPLLTVNKQQVKAMSFGVLGLLIYEVEQYWTERVFDVLDLGAIGLGYLISILIYQKIKEKNEL